jgi:hypothetical protein
VDYLPLDAGTAIDFGAVPSLVAFASVALILHRQNGGIADHLNMRINDFISIDPDLSRNGFIPSL